tara:strand:+ start:8517 stop:9131 length:615 start_codon:yes stop_codon:yes gene_type:complete
VYLYILSIFTLILSGLLLRFLLSIFKQKWIESISQTSTIVLLPIITFVITKVIAGNIALSLGMVGALSIVRFRTPVRSPLELTIYFSSIAMGISAAVRLKWLFFLNFSIILAVLMMCLVSFLYKKIKGKKFFYTSFKEGNSLSSLEIKSSEIIEYLEFSSLLQSKYFSNNMKKYLLLAQDFNELKLLTKDLDKDPRILEYQLNQ